METLSPTGLHSKEKKRKIFSIEIHSERWGTRGKCYLYQPEGGRQDPTAVFFDLGLEGVGVIQVQEAGDTIRTRHSKAHVQRLS